MSALIEVVLKDAILIFFWTHHRFLPCGLSCVCVCVCVCVCGLNKAKRAERKSQNSNESNRIDSEEM